MAQALESDELLVRYHLGELSPEQRDALENRFFADDAFHEQVLAAEEELIDSYLRKELSPAQKEHFEKWFLPVDDRRERLEFARALARYKPKVPLRWATGDVPHGSKGSDRYRLGTHPTVRQSSRSEGATFDVAYLDALKLEDPEVENHLISYFSLPLRLWLRKHLHSEELVDDALQETFKRLFGFFRAGKTLASPASLPGFVHVVCANVARELTRFHASGDESAGHEARRQALQSIVKEAFSERDTELLRRLLEGENRDSVCRRLGVDLTYLRVLVHRARIRLKAVS